jgi:hypothetical protein
MKTQIHKKKDGYAALVSVLIIGALTLVIGVGGVFRAGNAASISIDESLSLRARTVSSWCTQLALLKLQETLHYEGNESIINDDATCSILTVEGSGNADRVVKTESTVSGHFSREVVSIEEISPVMEIESWQYVANH